MSGTQIQPAFVPQPFKRPQEIAPTAPTKEERPADSASEKRKRYNEVFLETVTEEDVRAYAKNLVDIAKNPIHPHAVQAAKELNKRVLGPYPQGETEKARQVELTPEQEDALLLSILTRYLPNGYRLVKEIENGQHASSRGRDLGPSHAGAGDSVLDILDVPGVVVPAVPDPVGGGDDLRPAGQGAEGGDEPAGGGHGAAPADPLHPVHPGADPQGVGGPADEPGDGQLGSDQEGGRARAREEE